MACSMKLVESNYLYRKGTVNISIEKHDSSNSTNAHSYKYYSVKLQSL